MLLLQRCEITW